MSSTATITPSKISMPWRRSLAAEDSLATLTAPATINRGLTINDMHLGEFFFLPRRENIPVNSLPKPFNRNEGMFGHPVVVVKVSKEDNLVSFRSVTSSKDKDNETGRRARMQTRVCIQPKCGYTEVERRTLHNEYQMDRSYCLHEDSVDFKNPSEVLITEGLIFDVQPNVLRLLGWAKGNRVYLDVESTQRLVECPVVKGPASSPRRGSSSSDEGSPSRLSSASSSPSPKRRGVLTERSANITTPSTAPKADRMAGKWR